MRRPAAATRQRPRIAKPYSFAAPVSGWIANQNLAAPNARKPDGSKVFGSVMLENWFPTATGIRMRAGSGIYATLGDGSLPVTALFSYVNGNNRKLFATTESALYDITTISDPGILYLVTDNDDNLVNEDDDFLIIGGEDPELDSLTGGNWSVVQFSTSGGTFLRAVNGADTPLVYDGSAWATTPAITGVTPETLSNVWVYKSRIFYVQQDTLDAWYHAVDEIGGAVTKFPLGPVFGRGGALLFGSSWSLDTGNGLSEQCVFVSTEGEVAVYQGANPGDANDWQRVGTYRIGRPLGAKAFIRAGGDLIIATDIGFVPLSQAIQRDLAALSPSAVSYPIETAWNDIVSERSFADWHCEVWPTKQMVLVAVPTQTGGQAKMLAANARTGAWALFTNWNGTCLEVFGDRLFFGSTDGMVVEAEVTGADMETPYTATHVPLFDPIKNPGALKTSLLGRAVIRAPSRVKVNISLQSDYEISLPSAPDDISVGGGSLWGSGVWGQSTWGTPEVKLTFQEWQSMGGSGYALAPAVQVTSGNIASPDVELVQIDMTYDQGDIVT